VTGHALASLWAMLFGLLVAFPTLTPQTPYRFHGATLSASRPAVRAMHEEGTSRQVFELDEPLCLFVQLDEVRESHRYRVIAYRNGVEQWRRESAWRAVSSFGEQASRWWLCDEDNMLPGRWRFDVFVDAGVGFEFLTAQRAEVRSDRLYRFVAASTCTAHESSSSAAACLEDRSHFLAGAPVQLWATFAAVVSDHRFLVKTYRNGRLVARQLSPWKRARPKSALAHVAAAELNTVPGRYRFEFFIDAGAGFERVGERDFTVEVRSPVEGPLRLQCDWPEEKHTWAFCQHREGGKHAPTGVAAADDTRAWDVNLRDYADRGRPVFPVAAGRVVKYGDSVAPGSGRSGSVLVEHTTPGGDRWWSGYLHLKRGSVTVREGQKVSTDTVVGHVGATGADNSHLHLVVYEGENSAGGLKSMNAEFRPRYGTCVADLGSSPFAG
jgi:hypothetical protein